MVKIEIIMGFQLVNSSATKRKNEIRVSITMRTRQEIFGKYMNAKLHPLFIVLAFGPLAFIKSPPRNHIFPDFRPAATTISCLALMAR